MSQDHTTPPLTSSDLDTTGDLVSDTEEIDNNFPPGKIRRSIQHHIHHRLRSALEVVVETPTTRPPAKRREREHPFNNGKRSLQSNTGLQTQVKENSSKVTKYQSNKKPDEPRTNGDHTCQCDTGVQKYCLRQNIPFCVCTYKNSDYEERSEQCPQIPNIVDNVDGGGVPIGSKFYTHGDRSQNRNRTRNCTETGTLGTNNTGHTVRREQPTSDKSRVEPTSATTLRQPRNDNLGQVGPNVRRNNESSTTPTPIKATDQSDAKKNAQKKAERQATRESLQTTNIWAAENPSLNTTVYSKILWFLIIIVFIWLLLLTIFIFNPGSPCLLSVILSKIDECDNVMYYQVEP